MPGCSVKITNVTCEAKCAYCYEHTIREHGDASTDRPLNVNAVMEQMEKEWYKDAAPGSNYDGAPPYLHGGEALLAGHDVVETLMRKSFELAGHTNIQTYGYLIDRRFIDIFKRYKASVGVSIDGPWPLNKARVVPGRSSKEVTELVHKNILQMRAEGIPVSIICMLTKANATEKHLLKLKEWILWLKEIGVTGGRLNLMHADYKAYGKALELTEEEAEHAWRELFRFCKVENDGLNWQPFDDAVSSVLGLEQGTCVFGECQYFHASSEPVILSDGTTANCLKTAKSGHVYPRVEQFDGDRRGFGGVRYEVLPLVDIEDGGCKGCKHWRSCQGGCPAEGLQGDWRSRTRFCKAYYGLFEEAETYIKRLIPNVRFVSGAGNDGTKFPGNGAHGMWPPAFRYLDSRFTRSPSSWRGSAIKNELALDPNAGPPRGPVQGRIPVRTGTPGDPPSKDGWISDVEHVDGDTRHLDSNHGDGIRHADSGGSGRPDDGRMALIQRRLAESDEKLKGMKPGK